MTTTEFVNYYVNLLIMQYLDKPKARATIAAQTFPALMPQGGELVTENGEPVTEGGEFVYSDEDPDAKPILPLAVQAAFDIETAVGEQLDMIGRYLGIQRNGFDFSQAVELTEDQFRDLIRIMVVRNSMKADLKSIQDFIAEFFPDTLQIFDTLHMHNSWFYKKAIGEDILAEFFLKQGFLPRPLAVSAVVLGPFPTGNFFGFRTYLAEAPSYVSPLNTYSDYETDRPWLGYNNQIVL